MKQMTEAQLRKLLEDAYRHALEVSAIGHNEEMNPEWVNLMCSRYADKVLESL